MSRLPAFLATPLRPAFGSTAETRSANICAKRSTTRKDVEPLFLEGVRVVGERLGSRWHRNDVDAGSGEPARLASGVPARRDLGLRRCEYHLPRASISLARSRHAGLRSMAAPVALRRRGTSQGRSAKKTPSAR